MPGFVDISHQAVASALLAPLCASLWELLRRHRRPLSMPEIAVLAERPPGDVQSALDRLADAGLVRQVQARGTRRATAYEVDGDDHLVVTFDQADANAAGVVRELTERGIREARSVADAARGPDASPGDQSLDIHLPLALNEADAQAIMQALEGIRDQLCGLQSRPKGDGDPATRCNYYISIQLTPLRSGVLPLPIVHFVPADQAPAERERLRRIRLDDLSRRERQIAHELIRGRNRPEIAHALGVSVNTVATLTKRLYKKLGVRSRSQLAARVRAKSDPAG